MHLGILHTKLWDLKSCGFSWRVLYSSTLHCTVPVMRNHMISNLNVLRAKSPDAIFVTEYCFIHRTVYLYVFCDTVHAQCLILSFLSYRWAQKCALKHDWAWLMLHVYSSHTVHYYTPVIWKPRNPKSTDFMWKIPRCDFYHRILFCPPNDLFICLLWHCACPGSHFEFSFL